MEKDKLDRFITAVSTAADKQVNEILSEAEQERNNILSAAKESAEEAGNRCLSDNIKMTSGKCVRMVSKAELEMKKEILLCREKLTAELFDKVHSKLAEYRKTPEYEEKLCAAIAEEGDLEGARVYLSPEDMELSDAIAAASRDKVTVAADDSIKYGGLLILRSAKGTVTDRTFDCALKEQLSLFASGNLMTAQEGDRQ
ncbi:MAG: V-type ATP synthase subunit E [Huintestinicola sp.]|uniref:V-type ATP synthase subunit E n=1 Tax=Huintestinicola sp. TaxID=2981661 RepID=UPI003EFF1D67